MATLQTWPAHGPLQWELQPLSKGRDGHTGGARELTLKERRQSQCQPGVARGKESWCLP